VRRSDHPGKISVPTLNWMNVLSPLDQEITRQLSLAIEDARRRDVVKPHYTPL
jgi:hypothetical protein